jgi:hypothetical protein
VVVRVPLTAALKIAGVVRSEDGTPLEGAAVQFWQLRPKGRSRDGRTDDRGRFEFTGLVPGSGLLTVRHVGHGVLQRDVSAGMEDLAIVLAEAVEVSGTVESVGPDVDRSKMSVVFVPLGGAGGRLSGGSSVARDGTFRGSVAPGEHTAYAKNRGERGPGVPFTAKPGTPVRGLRLTAPGLGLTLRISGRVLTPAGEPEPRAFVSVQPRMTSVADDQGRFVVEVEPGVYRVEARGRSGNASVAGVAAGTTDLEIRLGAPGQVLGRVRDAGSADGLVVVAKGEGLGDRSVRVEPDGRYAVENLSPGTYRVHARAGTRVASSDAVEVKAGEVRRGVDLTLVEGGAIEGVVADAAGKPIADAWVESSHDAAPHLERAATDAEGRFRLAGLAAGTWRLAVGHPRLGGVLKPVVEVRLGRTESVTVAPE